MTLHNLITDYSAQDLVRGKQKMPKTKQNKDELHKPVLVAEVLQYLQPHVGQSYLDLTAGYGGHAKAILAVTAAEHLAVLVDRDAEAIASLAQRFSKAQIMHQDFASASAQLVEAGKKFDMILVDLGVSSPHLDIPSRGFSLKKPGPLDMRMDTRAELTAQQLVNTLSEAKLIRLLQDYGEEPKAKAIARAVIAARPISTTDQLAQIVSQASRWARRSKIHPATRTFQALRIAVNDELGQLEASLPLWQQLLAPGGRLVIISFHSLEDRLVKRYLAEHTGSGYDAQLSLLTKRPITARPDETVNNPRARSAKLRAAVKNKNK